MILILSDVNDVHADHVIKLLSASNANFFRLNLDKASLLDTKVLFYDSKWLIENKSGQITSNEVRAVWNRRTYVELLLEEQQDLSADFKIWKGEWNKTLLGLYHAIDYVFWLNFYRNSQRAENKYLQMSVAKEVGFKMPETLISNIKPQIMDFVKRHKRVALKMMHQDFYKDSDNNFKGLYVNVIDEDDIKDFQLTNENPIFLQEYIEKSFEVRYTVVGESHFVCKIESQSSTKTKYDWRRYDLANTPHSTITPPEEVRQMVNFMMRKMNLNYGAFDFIVNLQKEWYFLEVNPMGQYLWIEDLTGLEISASIANILMSNS